MSERKFKAGDLVVLKSGGPVMTVRDYNNKSKPEVNANWFLNQEIKGSTFVEDQLEIYQEPEKTKIVFG